MVWAGYILVCSVIAVQVALGTTGFRDYLEIKSTEDVYEDWRSLESKARNAMDQAVKQIMPYIVRSSSEMDISPECSASILKLVVDVRDFKEWAIKMLDATGKPGGGQLHGSTSALGSYNECLDITIPNSVGSSTKASARGSYCVLDIRPTLPPWPKMLLGSKEMEFTRNYSSSMEIIQKMKRYFGFFYVVGFRLGVCVPSTCGLQDIQEVARYVSEEMRIHAAALSCEVKEEVKLESDQVIVFCILGFFAFLTISATVAQLYLKCRGNRNSVCQQLADSFSLVSNVQQIFKKSSDTERDTTLSFLNGMRFISMTWIVLCHTHVYIDFRMMRETFMFMDSMKGLLFQVILNATVSVDTFLYITSVLLSYNLVTMTVNKKKKLPVLSVIWKRIWRLLPPALLMVCFTMVLPLMGSGPSWNEITQEARGNCHSYWWHLVLFINNYSNPFEGCLTHTWYISMDMQLFLFALIFIYFYKRYPRSSLVFLCGSAVTGIAVSAAVVWFLELTPTVLPTAYSKESMTSQFMYNYCMPYCHLAVYAIGLGMGTFLAKRTKFDIPMHMQMVGWILAVIASTSLIFVSKIWNSGDYSPIGLFPTIYSGLHRPLWALTLAWITLMCSKGHGGLLNKFLSWEGFTPLNRLTYLVYLSHVTVITYHEASRVGGVDGTKTSMVWLFFGNLVATFGFSFFLRVLFEAPMINAEKFLQQRLTRKEIPKAEIEKNATNEKVNRQSHNPQDVIIRPESFTRL